MGQFRPDIDPLKLPQYFWFYRHNGYVMGWLLKGVGGVSAAGGLIAALVYFRRQDALHGAARWASKAEARAASLAAQEGLLLRSEEHTSELQSLMRISYAVFCLKKHKKTSNRQYTAV